MIDHIDLDRVRVQSNHVSNYLAIDCRLVRDNEAVLARITSNNGGMVGVNAL